MKILITLLAASWVNLAVASEMPTNISDDQKLTLMEDLFEEAEVTQTIDKETGEVIGFKISHESLNKEDSLSFNKEEME